MTPHDLLEILNDVRKVIAPWGPLLVLVLPLSRWGREFLTKRLGDLFTAGVVAEQRRTNENLESLQKSYNATTTATTKTLKRLNKTIADNHKEGMTLIRVVTHEIEEHASDKHLHPNRNGVDR